jgi:hypothetical protein
LWNSLPKSFFSSLFSLKIVHIFLGSLRGVGATMMPGDGRTMGYDRDEAVVADEGKQTKDLNDLSWSEPTFCTAFLVLLSS